MFDVKREEPVQKNYDWFCAFDSLYGTTGLKALNQSQFRSINFHTVLHLGAIVYGQIDFWGPNMIFKRQIWRAMFGNVRET